PMHSLEVVVDAVDGFRRGVITQNRPWRTAFACPQVQRDQVRPLHRTPAHGAEVNLGRRHRFLLLASMPPAQTAARSPSWRFSRSRWAHAKPGTVSAMMDM